MSPLPDVEERKFPDDPCCAAAIVGGAVDGGPMALDEAAVGAALLGGAGSLLMRTRELVDLND